MVESLLKEGKKLKGFTIVSESTPLFAKTNIYGESTLSTSTIKNENMALMRVEYSSTSATYKATFGQPVEDINNIISQISTWVGDVEKASTSTSSSTGSSVSKGTSSLSATDYISVGGEGEVVTLNGLTGGISSTGDANIGGNLNLEGSLNINGTINYLGGKLDNTPIYRDTPNTVVSSNLISGSNKIVWNNTSSNGYFNKGIITLNEDTDKNSLFTITENGYYDITFYIHYNNSAATGTVSFAVKDEVKNAYTVKEYLFIPWIGYPLKKGDYLSFYLSGLTTDWVLSEMFLTIRYISPLP